MKFPVYLLSLLCFMNLILMAQHDNKPAYINENGTPLKNTSILNLLYGNSRYFGSDVLASYTRTSSDATGICIIPQKLQFMVTAAKAYKTNYSQYILAFTAAPLLKNNECQVPVGVLFLKGNDNIFKKVDAKPYFFNAGSFGQGGVYDIVQISHSTYAGLAISETEEDGISKTTLSLVGILDNKITNFTPEPIVIGENNFNGKQKPYYSWNATYTLKPGKGRLYDLHIEISGKRLENGIAVNYVSSLVYTYEDEQYQLSAKE